MRRVFAISAVAIVLAAASPARALQQSTRPPFYLQGLIGSISTQTDVPSNVYWHPELEFGFHTTLRGDGLVIGVRQGFDVSNCSGGETLARVGYDLAVPLGNGRFELTVAPYGVFGVDYLFNRPCLPIIPPQFQAGIRFGAGIEIKFTFYRNLYFLLRPAETDVAEFINPGRVSFYFTFGLGLGVSL